MVPPYVENDCPCLGIDVAFSYQLTSGSDLALHSHSFDEVFVIVSGEIDHECNGKKERLSTGDCRFLLPGDVHRFIRNGPCTHRDYEIRADLFSSIQNAIDPSLFPSESSQGQTRGFRLSLTDVAFLEEQMTFFSYVTEAHDREKLARFITYYLLSLYSTHKAAKLLEEDAFKRDCLAFIDRYFCNKNACSAIRSHFGYNDKYFCDKFRRSFGQTALVNEK